MHHLGSGSPQSNLIDMVNLRPGSPGDSYRSIQLLAEIQDRDRLFALAADLIFRSACARGIGSEHNANRWAGFPLPPASFLNPPRTLLIVTDTKIRRPNFGLRRHAPTV